MTFQDAYGTLITRLTQSQDPNEPQCFETEKLSDGFTVSWHLNRLRHALAVLNAPDPSDRRTTELSELDFRVSYRLLNEFLEQQDL